MAPSRFFACALVAGGVSAAVLHCGSDAASSNAPEIDASADGASADGTTTVGRDAATPPRPIVAQPCGPACGDAGGTCMAGADGGVCQLVCNGAGQCPEVACPEGMHCAITCNGAGVCANVDCTRASACDLGCNGADSCATVACAATTSCNVSCNGPGSCATVACAAAESCKLVCGGGCDHVCCAGAPCAVATAPRATCP